MLETKQPFEDIEIHIIELPKIKKYENETEKGLNTWLEFLSNPESEEVKISKEKDKELKDAYEKLEYISDDDELRRRADLSLMAILDENSRREGNLKILQKAERIQRENEKMQKELEKEQKELAEEKEKVAKEKREMIKKLKFQNMKMENIVEITGLTKEEIEKIWMI